VAPVSWVPILRLFALGARVPVEPSVTKGKEEMPGKDDIDIWWILVLAKTRGNSEPADLVGEASGQLGMHLRGGS